VSNVRLPTTTPRLQARLEHYKIEPPKWMPSYDRVFILPLGAADQVDTTAGGIAIALSTQESLGSQRGIIVAAGAKGWEELYAAGYQIGDIVVTNRLSRWEKTYMVAGRGPYRVLIVSAGELTAGEDLYDAFERGDLWYEMDPSTGKVYVADRDGTHDRNDPKPAAYGV
jgi:co-chaperonin GroES (HSP10)